MTDPFFQVDRLRVYCDDFLTTEAVDNETIDLVVTSPPYNVDIAYGSYNDQIPYDAYLEFSKEWIKRAFAVAKAGGRFCLNVPLDKNKGGQQSVYSDVTAIAKEVGWKYHSTIVWNEQNISRRTAWGSWLSASAPYVIAPVEMVVVLYKGTWKRPSNDRTSDVERDEFIEWTNGMWTFRGESKKRTGHPTPFPVELPYRCIKLFSFVEDTVLDPFLGSGSTLVACAMSGRAGIGIDIDEGYCELASRRIREQIPSG